VPPIKIFVSAGEASGDALLAKTLAALRQLLGVETPLILAGLGGPLSEAQGLASLFPLSQLSVNGIGDVLRHLPFLWRMDRRVKAELIRFDPDIVVLVDYPGFNLRLMRLAKQLGKPVFYLVPPQGWAKRPSPAREKRRRALFAGVSVQVLFPFEVADFTALGADVAQGNCFTMVPNPDFTRQTEQGSKAILLLCPGSRPAVLRRNLGAWLVALHALNAQPEVTINDSLFTCRHIQVLVPPWLRDTAKACLLSQPFTGEAAVSVEIVTDKTKALSEASQAICFPGTMTLELACAGIPTVVVGILDAVTFAIGRRIVITPWFALANILLQSRIIPEWVGLQRDFGPKLLQALMEERRDGFNESEMALGIQTRLLAVLGQSQGENVAAERILRLVTR
jgi:lipid-A-disaccharide synthase